MARVQTVEIPLRQLAETLETARREMEARALLAVDGCGDVRGTATVDPHLDASTLGALGAAQMAASLETLRMAGLAADSEHVLILDHPGGAVLLSAGRSGFVFVALLTNAAGLGLARLEMARLASIRWTEDPGQNETAEIERLAEGILGRLGQGL